MFMVFRYRRCAKRDSMIKKLRFVLPVYTHNVETVRISLFSLFCRDFSHFFHSLSFFEVPSDFSNFLFFDLFFQFFPLF